MVFRTVSNTTKSIVVSYKVGLYRQIVDFTGKMDFTGKALTS